MSDEATGEESGPAEDEESAPLPVEALRTVTPPYRSRRDVEMDAVGWSMFVLLLFVLLPFLPILAIVWLIDRALDAVAGE